MAFLVTDQNDQQISFMKYIITNYNKTSFNFIQIIQRAISGYFTKQLNTGTEILQKSHKTLFRYSGRCFLTLDIGQ